MLALRTLQKATRITSRFSTAARYSSTLIISDPLPTPSTLPPSTLSAITAAKKLHSGPITLLLLSPSCPEIPSDVENVILAETEGDGGDLLAESAANAVTLALKEGDFSHILACATKFGGNFLPRVGGMLGVSPITDVVEILGEDTFVRPMYAGNILAKVISGSSPKLLSIRPPSFEKNASPLSAASSSTTIKPPSQTQSIWVSQNVSQSERPELSSASVVVSGGRGMGNGENFSMLYDLADKMKGAVGASRAAVDAGYVPNDLQVGQTGKVVAPDLYMAVGISGAIQHLSGMKDSKTIVAINKDEEAPIFQVADYGLVDDLFQAVPEITEKI